jgi:hypothetical protein
MDQRDLVERYIYTHIHKTHTSASYHMGEDIEDRPREHATASGILRHATENFLRYTFCDRVQMDCLGNVFT